MIVKRTTAQNADIARKRHSELCKTLNLSSGFSCQGVVGQFVDRYILCEIIGKKIQKYYQHDLQKPTKPELNLTVLKAALKHFKCDFDGTLLADILRGGGGKKGEKSARQLRNGYLHSLNPEDKVEIEQNFDVLIKKIEEFLEVSSSIFSNKD